MRPDLRGAGRAGKGAEGVSRSCVFGTRRAPSAALQSWQPDTSRDALAQHCAAFSGAQQVFFAIFVSSFIVVLLRL